MLKTLNTRKVKFVIYSPIFLIPFIYMYGIRVSYALRRKGLYVM